MSVTLKSKAEEFAQKACELDAFASINLFQLRSDDVINVHGQNELVVKYLEGKEQKMVPLKEWLGL